MSRMNSEELQRMCSELTNAELKFFRNWPDRSIPTVSAGVYAIWDLTGRFIYVGMSGWEISKRRNSIKPYGLVTRLGSHASGRLSGDQFCVYIANRIIIPDLNQEDLAHFRDGSVTLDQYVKRYITNNLSYRFILLNDEKGAMELEEHIRRFGLGGSLPFLNGKNGGGEGDQDFVT